MLASPFSVAKLRSSERTFTFLALPTKDKAYAVIARVYGSFMSFGIAATLFARKFTAPFLALTTVYNAKDVTMQNNNKKKTEKEYAAFNVQLVRSDAYVV